MNALPVADLLSPIDDQAPCGVNLEYEPAFRELEEAAKRKGDQEFGETKIAAQEPDWRAVYEQALDLLGKTRDLRIAVLLARASARQHGGLAYLDALALIAGLLERHWSHVHPQLDHDDNDDPMMRVGALLPLVDPATGLADLRSANLGEPRMPLMVRQIELVAGRTRPNDGESVPTQEGVLEALSTANAKRPGLVDTLARADVDFKRIESVLADKLRTGRAPDLRPLGAVLRSLATMAKLVKNGTVAADTGEEAEASPVDAVNASPQRLAAGSVNLRQRDEVVQSLERACEWIERNEPTNPAPLLIRRAQRLMNLNFIDIIRDLAPTGLDEVKKIAGSANS